MQSCYINLGLKTAFFLILKMVKNFKRYDARLISLDTELVHVSGTPRLFRHISLLERTSRASVATMREERRTGVERRARERSRRTRSER